jgi:hypothetical protein
MPKMLARKHQGVYMQMLLIMWLALSEEAWIHLKSSVFRDETPLNLLEVYRRFGHHQGR